MERFEIRDDVDKAFEESWKELMGEVRIKQVYNGDTVVARRVGDKIGIHMLADDSVIMSWNTAVELAKAILKENGAIVERERTPLKGLDGLSWPDDSQAGTPPVEGDLKPKITYCWSEFAGKPDLDDWTSNDLTDGIRK